MCHSFVVIEFGNGHALSWGYDMIPLPKILRLYQHGTTPRQRAGKNSDQFSGEIIGELQYGLCGLFD